ncbi:L-asparaginase II [Microlunatus sagamiharensis]|uniref:L-asparaginase II n=1 Tax=Microlunatus sagamiharensis TaxID=546874 RepID=A0A1H2NIS7_9ACTN|nr:asparaginase [Microlunatus sagamiharensis]SDV05081.1 L-asparaginase II [Microlunatus sagamiharensis]
MLHPFDTDPVLVEVVRDGLVESVHHGRVAVTGPDGSLLASLGDPDALVYPRSSNKPLQAVGMVRAGLDLSDELLALTSASHSGEVFHREGAARILGLAGLDEDALQDPPDWPLDDLAKEELLRAGGQRSRLAMNCSGKHAGMLLTAVRSGAPTGTYLEPSHPVQRAIEEALADLAGEKPSGPAVDGCGAPLWALSLTALARSFGRLAASTEPTEQKVADAVRAHPAYVSGTRRDELALHQGLPGIVAKAGAESVYAVGLPDGRGVALKIDDGSTRGRAVVMAAVLMRLGLDAEVLRSQSRVAVLGGGRPVGEVRPYAPTLEGIGA